jgi:ElaB/YqjD/DUF883 family membrane-anchored ribosome-binding protein
MTPASMPTTPSENRPTPEQRLAANRERLVSYMTLGHEASSHQDAPLGDRSRDPAVPRKNAALQTLLHTVKAWWTHHPAKMALEIAEPVLNKFAKDKPYQMLGIAAVVGAATVLVRPWRVVSFTSLLLATIKSTGLGNVVLALVRSQPKQGERQEKQTRE